MTFKRPVDYTIDAVKELASSVEKLAACLVQGVKRPWRTPPLTADRRRELDRAAHAERIERVDIAPGESPAPLDLDVMDELVEILSSAEDLRDRLSRAVLRPIDPPASSAFADPRPCLLTIVRLLPEAVGSPWDPTVVRAVADKVEQLQERASEALGLVTDGQVLDAICPWCAGRTPSKPNGGERTLRIRNVDGMDHTVVLCEGGLCRPPESDCGRWIHGKPAWTQAEWDWLSDRIDRVAAQTGEGAA